MLVQPHQPQYSDAVQSPQVGSDALRLRKAMEDLALPALQVGRVTLQHALQLLPQQAVGVVKSKGACRGGGISGSC